MKIEIYLKTTVACTVDFDLNFLKSVEEGEAKKTLRKLYDHITACNEVEELSVVPEKTEDKATLNKFRAEAIKTWLTHYKAYGFGNYQISHKDKQLTIKQCRLVLDEEQLRKYFECSEWFATDKLLSKYCSADIQNRLNQKPVEKKTEFPDDWDSAYYNKLGEKNRVAYAQHLISIGFVRFSTESGIWGYRKKHEKYPN